MNILSARAMFAGMVAIALSTPAISFAATMDFNNLSTTSGGLILDGTTITQNGFTITDTSPGSQSYQTQFLGAAAGWQGGRGTDNGTTTVDMISPNSNTPLTFTLTSQTGTPFNFTSIDIGAENAHDPQFFNSDATVWTFEGFLAGGGTVSQTIDTSPTSILTYDLNSAFQDLTSVNITAELPVMGIQISNGAGIAADFDNIVAGQYGSDSSSVPEPESYAMLVIGLGLIGLAARRKAA